MLALLLAAAALIASARASPVPLSLSPAGGISSSGTKGVIFAGACAQCPVEYYCEFGYPGAAPDGDNDDTPIDLRPTIWGGYQFRMPSDSRCAITSLTVRMQLMSATMPIFEIRADNSGTPSSTVLDTLTAATAGTPGPIGSYTYTASATTYSADTVFWIVARSPASVSFFLYPNMELLGSCEAV
ncbi:hypothetical protein DFJ74DRAFT_709804 [Hyaloraphidium curvatum]|nr:hypothetical protein DFJ74DRAFT_709804 [Hyaloraphidium curvatum]